MCGFAGILGSSEQQELLRMASAIAHRGPDSHGIWQDSSSAVALVHQRLAVVDITSTGHQPMASGSGRYQLSYNGEIYNHNELRQQLESHDGFTGWRGLSDTETLLTAIELLGLSATLPLLVGMFAFALWDCETGELHLARDRLGEKPLYYGWHNQRFLFASELHALRHADQFHPEIDRQAVALYLRHNHFPAPFSVYQGVYKLVAGSVLTITDEHRNNKTLPVPHRYWSAVETARQCMQSPFTGDEREAEDEVERLLSHSIAQQMVADVPVGAFLSGGIDSSTVSALMQKQASQPIKTFCIGFEEEKFNEATHARDIARQLRTDHTEVLLGDKDARNLVDRLPALLDEPFADASQLPTLVVSELARQQVTVSLSGDGGDELFGGYTRYGQATRVIGHRHRLGLAGRSIARAVTGSSLTGYSLTGMAQPPVASLEQNQWMRQLYRGFQLIAHENSASAYCDMLSYWRYPHTPLIADPIKKSIEGGDSHTSPLLDPTHWLKDCDPQSAIQLLDVQHYLSDDILHKVDRAAMSVSLETRIPMLDHRLMEFVWSLPPSMRANAQRPKAILKAIASRYVPPEQIHRPKMGFGIPLAYWLRGPLKSWAESLLEPLMLTQQGLLDPGVVTTVWKQLQVGNDNYADALWCVLMLQLWMVSHHA